MFEKLINLIFGCNHPERHHSSLPFTQDGMSYRVCLKCGTRIAFSVEDLNTSLPVIGDANAGRPRAPRISGGLAFP
jgi:hypothetical protein